MNEWGGDLNVTSDGIKAMLKQACAAFQATVGALIPQLFADEPTLSDHEEISTIIGAITSTADRLQLGYIEAFDRRIEPGTGAQLKKEIAANLRIPVGKLRYLTNVANNANLNGTTGRPRLERADALFNDSVIGLPALSAITETLAKIPVSEYEARKGIEEKLCLLAEASAPEGLRTAGIKLLQDHGFGADEEARREQASFRIGTQRPDLMTPVRGLLEPRAAALLNRVFHDYAGPGDLLEEKADDDRSPDQRRHDALEAALRSAVDHELKPSRPGCAAVVATLTLQDLCEFNGVAVTDVGTTLPLDELLKMGAEKHWYLAILDHKNGNLLHLSRTKRTADLHMYLGLLASQGGDQTPGYGLPAAACEVHHVEAWADGGLTTPDNLVFLNPRTHRQVDDDRIDRSCYWTVQAGDRTVAVRRPWGQDPSRSACSNIHPALWLVPGIRLKHGVRPPPLKPSVLSPPKLKGVSG